MTSNDDLHPDVVAIDAMISERFQMVLDAEHRAALTAVTRFTSLRDRLIEIEDRAEPVTINTGSGPHHGVVTAVGIDHIVVEDASTSVVVALDAIRSVRR